MGRGTWDVGRVPWDAVILSCLRTPRPFGIGLAALLLAAGCAKVPLPGPPPLPPPEPDPSDLFFADDTIREIALDFAPPEMQRLRVQPRAYASGTMSEVGVDDYVEVAIKLKGAAGSFRGIDDRPAFTLNVGKFADGRTWRGLKKFHFNNSVQDETLACELVASRTFAAAGIATPRASHARVRLNGRDLGFYVVKEGFDNRFLKRHFPRADGNLYDGGFCQDLDARLERDEGRGDDTKADLRAVVAACREQDPSKRYPRLAELVDIEQFLKLMAVELMLCHWDGYTINRNNYRVYFNPVDGRLQILPHGLDQLFQDPGFGILGFPGTLLSAAVMGNGEWRRRYRALIGELLPLFEPARLHAIVDEVARRLQPALAAVNPGRARVHAQRIRELKERMKSRYASLKEQHVRPDPVPLAFDGDGVARLDAWWPAGGEESELLETEADRRPALSIRGATEAPFGAAWRRRVLLRRGIYLLEAVVRTEDIVAPRGGGAAVRASGAARSNRLVGTQDWTLVQHRFAVTDDSREFELVLDLRANSGQVWFDRRSLLLRKVEK